MSSVKSLQAGLYLQSPSFALLSRGSPTSEPGLSTVGLNAVLPLFEQGYSNTDAKITKLCSYNNMRKSLYFNI